MAFKSSGVTRKLSEAVVAVVAKAGVAIAVVQKMMPSVDTILKVSDWPLAKALHTITCSYLLMRPALSRSPEDFYKAVVLPAPYARIGDEDVI